MTKKEIVEGNILIAKFMGYEYVPKSEGKISGYWKAGIQDKIKNVYAASKLTEHYFLAKHHRDIRYYNSWDWLMPVVSKIKNQGNDVIMHDDICIIMNKGYDITSYDTMDMVKYGSVCNLLRSTYEACVEFITKLEIENEQKR